MAQEDSSTKDNSDLVLERDPETDEPLITLADCLGDVLKPHQVSGIKFMYASTVGSIRKLESGDQGNGCILAHCMGLGKTLQSVALIDALLSNQKCSEHIKRVIICCPKTTIHNWKSEFERWIPEKRLEYQVMELISTTDIRLRIRKLEDWYENGGVCIISYNMFRLLANNKKYSVLQKTLLCPGPDLIICDEGHIIKNDKSAISKALFNLTTKRRVTLTGTPMQNNLLEYHCMVQFIQPDKMGNRKDFIKKFVKPIEAGQCANASKWEVTKMKKRAHVLHEKLQGCIQRMDYLVLRPYLQAKYEYVIYIQMSNIQDLLYRYYLENLAQGNPGVTNDMQKKRRSGLFVDYNHLSRVWTHPLMFLLSSKNVSAKSPMVELDQSQSDISEEHYLSDDETETRQKRKQMTNLRRAKKSRKKFNLNENYISENNSPENSCDSSDDERGPLVIDDTTDIKLISSCGITKDELVPRDWWKSVLRENNLDCDDPNFMHQIEHSGKLLLLLDILRECTLLGEKLLVFSQSLLVLDTIEKLLGLIDCGALNFPEGNESSREKPRYTEWKKETAVMPTGDYMRLDGSTPAEERKTLCKSFNDKQNERCRLFLISTRAGGLGINLVAANRVIIFDSSWNPSNDIQSIFRVYRFGQSKPCFIYRFVAQGTMEEKIYSRQITKTSTSLRVIDHHQVKRHYDMAKLSELYRYAPADVDERQIYHLPEDHLLAELLRRRKKWIVDYHEQDSLLENIENEELSEDERKAAWEEYEKDREEKEIAKEIVPVSLPPLIALESDGEDEVQILKHYNSKDEYLEQLKNVYLSEDYHQFDSTFPNQMCGGTFMESQKPFNENLSNQVYNNQNFSENTLESTFYSNNYHPYSNIYDPLLGNEHSNLIQTAPINLADCDKNYMHSEQSNFDSSKSLRPSYENDSYRISTKDTDSWESRVWESRPTNLDYRAPTTMQYSPVMSSEDEKDPFGIEDSSGYQKNGTQLECDNYSVDNNTYEWISEPNSPVMPGEMNEFDIQNLLNKEIFT